MIRICEKEDLATVKNLDGGVGHPGISSWKINRHLAGKSIRILDPSAVMFPEESTAPTTPRYRVPSVGVVRNPAS